jgi:carbonic anhydrase
MGDLKELLDRNRAYVAAFDGGALPIAPRFRQIVLSCVDARVDPGRYFGLDLGEALEMRTLGGRVTDGAERDLAVLVTLAIGLAGPDAQPPQILVVQHTDCGLERFADASRRQALSRASGIAEQVFAELAIPDHVASLQADVRRLRESSMMPEGVSVAGYLYSHETGAVTEVVQLVE